MPLRKRINQANTFRLANDKCGELAADFNQVSDWLQNGAVDRVFSSRATMAMREKHASGAILGLARSVESRRASTGPGSWLFWMLAGWGERGTAPHEGG
jgi:hypothetical protein